MTQLLPQLRRLTRLRELKVTNATLGRNDFQAPFSLNDTLPSVQRLTLTVMFDCTPLLDHYLAVVFPGLRELTLVHPFCALKSPPTPDWTSRYDRYKLVNMHQIERRCVGPRHADKLPKPLTIEQNILLSFEEHNRTVLGRNYIIDYDDGFGIFVEDLLGPGRGFQGAGPGPQQFPGNGPQQRPG